MSSSADFGLHVVHQYSSVRRTSVQQPHFQPQAHTRAVADFHLMPPEACPCSLDSTCCLDIDIPICADCPTKVHKLVRVCAHLAGSGDGEGHLPPPSLVCRHIISVLDSEAATPNAVHNVTIAITIPSNVLGDRDTMPASSAHSIPHSVWASSSAPPPVDVASAMYIRTLISPCASVMFYSLSYRIICQVVCFC